MLSVLNANLSELRISTRSLLIFCTSCFNESWVISMRNMILSNLIGWMMTFVESYLARNREESEKGDTSFCIPWSQPAMRVSSTKFLAPTIAFLAGVDLVKQTRQVPAARLWSGVEERV